MPVPCSSRTAARTAPLYTSLDPKNIDGLTAVSRQTPRPPCPHPVSGTRPADLVPARRLLHAPRLRLRPADSSSSVSQEGPRKSAENTGSASRPPRPPAPRTSPPHREPRCRRFYIASSVSCNHRFHVNHVSKGRWVPACSLFVDRIRQLVHASFSALMYLLPTPMFALC